ncbi:phosphate/phosphite/phosphonate ABC transporter substrate-binding protein [Vibrio parahaemolyticus]|uniref:phosphate/phosphite/phosphonate ABC transporter substrate-binding protein n=1 Tax=Vibrio parahaemolyticus TaxID=670 RepID=UPI001E3D7399|nr:phosphate/phosphite/phosphonate ABC transporter substrate-binding protein [Vibrio parahaemolyticus]EJC6861570.1 phosphate/phosphite/phosphonate ABC transporter substrate-binding protein [Vibrio parahaemolyticus]EJC7038638.1 phosphate/phosphite/phosphonate ABC transporter substrate-binding protein [Vibrio parahaemolyticus]ELA8156598.1 phosphate/phosphite/phosphonate ABC transporter substrate-binding protein [Vibrio parahaemolyticus]
MNTKKSLLKWSIAASAAIASLSVQALDDLKIALIPSEDSRAMIKQSEVLINGLSEQLGVKVEGFVATDYNGVIEALRAGHVDIAYLGPFSYVKAAEVADVEAFVVAETAKAGDVAYHSQIIAPANADDINQLSDLKGKNFAFVSPTSTSGYVFPYVGLRSEGIEPRQFFANVVYTGAHDANILAVKHGRVDAATVADRILSSAVEKGIIGKDEYKVIWRSESIPESPMVWRNDIPEADKARIKQAFLSMKSVQFGDQGIVNRYVETNDAAYDPVREAAKFK